MRILVTGGAGFIGSTLCNYLVLDQKDQVLNIDKLTYAANLHSLQDVADNPLYQFEKIDICDGAKINALFAQFKPDIVIHLAAESHVDRSIGNAAEFVQTNINGTFIMLNAALSYWKELRGNEKSRFRFLHVSTDEVYGSLGETGLFNEQTAYDPSSPYSASKAAADHLAMSWHRTYGLPVVISNCSNNYGPRQFPEKLIPLMIVNALEGRELPIYGVGANIRDWLHVNDHVRALRLIALRGRLGEKYNVGAKNERTNLEVVHKICTLLDEHNPPAAPHKKLIRFVLDRPGHDLRYAIDASKLETELGWSAKYDFDSGVRETLQWYLDNENWWRPLHNIHAGERLGIIENHD